MFHEIISHASLNCILFVLSRWRVGYMTNFQYLTELNKMAGRSFNDLMQYPVFPFVLADFGHEVLDLTDDKSFRYCVPLFTGLAISVINIYHWQARHLVNLNRTCDGEKYP